MARGLSLVIALLSILGGCARGGGWAMDVGSTGLDAPSGADSGRTDVPGGIDSGRIDTGSSDAGHTDGGRIDTGSTSIDSGRDSGSMTGGLDPSLDVPPAGNEPCSDPGNLSECSGIAVCRFYSATEGRCESCTACGNLFDPCSSGEDCDILFVCFMGQCTNFCTLGSFECGPPTDCIDIGHPTQGACLPGF